MRLTSCIAVEGDDVVIKLEGNRGRKPWIDVTRIYVMRASVRFEKNGWWLVKDESSHVYHWDEDAYPQTFIDALASAKSAVVAAKHAPPGRSLPTQGQCAHCGAQAQPIGGPCSCCLSTARR